MRRGFRPCLLILSISLLSAGCGFSPRELALKYARAGRWDDVRELAYSEHAGEVASAMLQVVEEVVAEGPARREPAKEEDGRLPARGCDAADALQIVAEIGPAAAAMVPALLHLPDVELIEVPEAEITTHFLAGVALYWIGAAGVPELARALASEDSSIRDLAVHALNGLGPEAADAVPALLEALDGAAPPFRYQLLRALSEIGPAARPAMPTLVSLLKSEDWNTRSGAVRALGGIGPDVGSAVPSLLRLAAAGPDPGSGRSIRSKVAEALGQIGPEARAAVPALIDMLSYGGRDGSVHRHRAAEALGRITAASAVAVPALVTALRDTSRYVRDGAVEALGRIGPAAREASPALMRMLGEEKWGRSRVAVAEALWKITRDADSVLPTLVRLLESKDGTIPEGTIAGLLIAIGPEARAAVPALEGYVDHWKTAANPYLVEALWRLTGEAERVVPRMIPLIQRAPGVRKIRLMGEIGPAAKSAVPALQEALRSKNWRVRAAAAEALPKVCGQKE